MRKFATYIEYLLMTRHYCYVPGRGAYMLSDEPATLGTHPSIGPDSRRMHKLESPRRVVRFSPLHHHDDGMLANLLMEAEGMTYDEACRYIERQAPLLPEDFHESASLRTDTENFGYNELMFETWGDIEARLKAAANPVQPAAIEEKKSREADIIAIPRYWAQRVAVVLLIAVCFFASFLGLDDQQTQQQYANVLDLSLLQRGAMLQQQTWDEEEDIEFSDEDDIIAGDELGDVYAYGSEEEEENSEDEPSEDYESDTAEAEAEAVEVEEEPIVSKPLTVAPNGKLYYIIVASCPDMKDAERALNNLRKQGYTGVGVLERDDRCRLYINRFGDKAEAEAYLKSLRQDSNFSSAWLLPVREASLSIIIKNTYDDNQLFMELSHPNKRTERDQG